MSPIDDELRAALHGRAQVLSPSPDPLSGIERRAKKIQRNRIGAAVAGSVLAVSAIAVAVPAIQSATSSGPDVPRYASPSAEPTISVSPYVLDPDAPWAYRGTPLDQLGTGTVETIKREYAVKLGIDEAALALTPLWGQIWEPSGQAELVFLAEVDGSYRWGVARGGEAGPEFALDEPLGSETMALAAALPGDEGGRLVVVAAPSVSGISYAPQGPSSISAMQEIAPGVATVFIGQGGPDDYYVVVDDEGEQVHRAPAPDLTALPVVEEPTTKDPVTGEPAAALDPDDPWAVRGDRSLVTDGQLDALGDDWASRKGVDPAGVEVTPLYVQRNESDAGVEVVYLVRSGSGPWSWGVSALGEGGWWWYADNELFPGTGALAAALPGDEGVERLLVVAAPSMGGGMYAADGSDFEPMTDLDAGVFITPISPGDPDDRYMVLDGDGDLDNPAVQGAAPDFQNAG